MLPTVCQPSEQLTGRWSGKIQCRWVSNPGEDEPQFKQRGGEFGRKNLLYGSVQLRVLSSRICSRVNNM